MRIHNTLTTQRTTYSFTKTSINWLPEPNGYFVWLAVWQHHSKDGWHGRNDNINTTFTLFKRSSNRKKYQKVECTKNGDEIQNSIAFHTFALLDHQQWIYLTKIKIKHSCELSIFVGRVQDFDSTLFASSCRRWKSFLPENLMMILYQLLVVSCTKSL